MNNVKNMNDAFNWHKIVLVFLLACIVKPCFGAAPEDNNRARARVNEMNIADFVPRAIVLLPCCLLFAGCWIAMTMNHSNIERGNSFAFLPGQYQFPKNIDSQGCIGRKYAGLRCRKIYLREVDMPRFDHNNQKNEHKKDK